MTEASSLDALCERHGIASRYEDAWGTIRPTPDRTRLALLQAMGIATDEAAPDQPPAAPDAGALLPPVVVAAEGAACVALPCREAQRLPATLSWRIDLETGDELTGSIASATATAGDDGRLALPIPAPAAGYHRLSIRDAATGAPLASIRLIVAPARCYLPPELAGGARIWGLALQLYALRSHRNWGIGDFTDLIHAIDAAAADGADIVGVNPLHALFPARPELASPYSPSNRTALNVLYLDVEAIADFAHCRAARSQVYRPAFQRELASLRAADHVDYALVARLKLEILEMLYADFRRRELGATPGERGRAFRDYQRERGPALELHGLFDALQEHVAASTGRRGGWQVWPEEYRRPSPAQRDRLSRRHAERAEYFEYLQWQAEIQLAGACERARARGMIVGLYADLAVGADAGGAETWSNDAVYAPDVHIGAPPDDFNLQGQDWGLPPPLPDRLRATGYEPFIAVLRTAMRHAGALRIDHVMALMRLFWVPSGSPAIDGAYVAYPFADLLGIIALESQRNRCMVIGEDLGTIGPGVRTTLAAAAVLSYRPLYFERTAHGDFAPPEAYPSQSLVTVGTHDLPTLAGFWTGRDIAVRSALHLYPGTEVRDAQLVARTRDRTRLVAALDRAGVLATRISPHRLTVDLMLAVHRFVARTPAMLMAVQLEDVFGQGVQANLPSTTEAQYPNWRRKLAVPVESWPNNRRLAAVTRMLRKERRHAMPRPARHSSTAPRRG
ncbi:MAG TPA: 4-alpha-glucanotransferase [Casimicrobiaceae bacterium]|nr:4-alpha-glucanotransferase [Casimicrobiaceae bacterium]